MAGNAAPPPIGNVSWGSNADDEATGADPDAAVAEDEVVSVAGAFAV